MSYEVQTWTLFGGWVNSWAIDDKPQTFETYLEAMAELSEWISESERLAAEGVLDAPYSFDDYRIVEVQPEESR